MAHIANVLRSAPLGTDLRNSLRQWGDDEKGICKIDKSNLDAIQPVYLSREDANALGSALLSRAYNSSPAPRAKNRARIISPTIIQSVATDLLLYLPDKFYDTAAVSWPVWREHLDSIQSGRSKWRDASEKYGGCYYKREFRKYCNAGQVIANPFNEVWGVFNENPASANFLLPFAYFLKTLEQCGNEGAGISFTSITIPEFQTKYHWTFSASKDAALESNTPEETLEDVDLKQKSQVAVPAGLSDDEKVNILRISARGVDNECSADLIKTLKSGVGMHSSTVESIQAWLGQDQKVRGCGDIKMIPLHWLGSEDVQQLLEAIIRVASSSAESYGDKISGLGEAFLGVLSPQTLDTASLLANLVDLSLLQTAEKGFCGSNPKSGFKLLSDLKILPEGGARYKRDSNYLLAFVAALKSFQSCGTGKSFDPIQKMTYATFETNYPEGSRSVVRTLDQEADIKQQGSENESPTGQVKTLSNGIPDGLDTHYDASDQLDHQQRGLQDSEEQEHANDVNSQGGKSAEELAAEQAILEELGKNNAVLRQNGKDTTYDPMDVHALMETLTREMRVAKKAVELWSSIGAVGSLTADASARIIYISALSELVSLISSHSAAIGGQLSDVNQMLALTTAALEAPNS